MNQNNFENLVRGIVNEYKNGEDCRLDIIETSTLSKKVYDQMNYDEHITDTPVDVSKLLHEDRNTEDEIAALLYVKRNKLDEKIESYFSDIECNYKYDICINTAQNLTENDIIEDNLDDFTEKYLSTIDDFETGTTKEEE